MFKSKPKAAPDRGGAAEEKGKVGKS
jgi:hypothetical protein